MKSFFKFSPFEWSILLVGLISTIVCTLILVSGATLFSFPDFSESIAPPVFDAQYVSVSAETPEPQPSTAPLLERTPVEAPAKIPERTETKTSEAPSVAPLPELELTKHDRIFLIYPSSQAIIAKTQASEKKGYPLKLKFEVDPKNTPCRLELKKGDEVILVKEFEGSPTGLFEVTLSIKTPALYKWQVFTKSTQSGERLFTIRK